MIRLPRPVREVSRNWRILLLSFALASAAWHVAQDKLNFARLFAEVPVQVRVPEGLSLLRLEPATVVVRLRGLERDLRAVNPASVEVDLDLTGLDGGPEVRAVIRNRDVRFPGNFQVADVSPREVDLVIDAMAERSVPVKPRIRGTPAGGVEFELRTTPATARVSGPRSLIANLESIATEEIDIDGLRQSRTVVVPLAAPPDVPWIRLDPSRVQVELQVVDRSVAREFEGIPIRILEAAGRRADLITVPAEAAVTLAGRADVVASLEPSDLILFVDGAGMRTPGEVIVPVRWVAPPGVQVQEVRPATVTLTGKESR